MKALKYTLAVILFVSATRLQANPVDLKLAVNNLLKSYFSIKNALVTDNSKTANDEAKNFTAALKEVQVSQMDAKQKAAWQKYAEKLRFDGEHIGESAAIAHQREHFSSLSANMYAVLKAFRNNDLAIYEQYCPMVKKSWISESAAIKNPYMGKSDPACGVVKETLKAGK